MTILQLNKRSGRRFVFSGMLFALCALRSIALSVRVAWAAHARAADVAIAAGILTQTGSVLVFIVNLFLAQRIVRARHPVFGWRRPTGLAFRFLVACVVASLVMVVAVTIQTFFTLDAGIRRADRVVQLFAGTYMAVLAFLPIPVVLLAILIPRGKGKGAGRVEKFGTGRWRTKVWLLLFTSVLATLGAAFRVATGYMARPANDPAWYHSRACYYCFNFVTDLIISAVYLFSRFDRRFIVPNGAKGPGDYSSGNGIRVRAPSVASSDGGEANGDTGEKDPEKFAKDGNSSSTEGGSEKSSLPILDGSGGKGKGKEKGKDVAPGLESDDKQAVKSPDSATAIATALAESRDAQTQTPPGPWYGSMPWPFRPSWAVERNSANSGPLPSSSTNRSSTGDDNNSTEIGSPAAPAYSSAEDHHHPHHLDEASSQWGGETSSSTCIQEPESAHLKAAHQRRQFHPHQLHHQQQQQQNQPQQHGPTQIFGQALTSDEQIHIQSRPIWPAATATVTAPASVSNEAFAPRHAPSPSNSSTAASSSSSSGHGHGHGHSHVGSSRNSSNSRAFSRGRTGRSQSCGRIRNESVEGGWI